MANGEAPDKSPSVMPRWPAKLWHDHPLWVLTGGAALALAVIVAFIWPITDLIAAHDVGLTISPKRAAALQTAREAVRTQLLTLGAGLLAAGALVFTAWNVTLYRKNLTLYGDTNTITERGQVTDRYTKAIEQLGSDKLDVRIGGIYALERVARDSGRDRSTVREVLAAFVRENSREHWLPAPPDGETPYRTTRPDVQAAATVICRQGDIPFLFDLTHVELPFANLAQAKLANVDLTGANLDGANLSSADLSGARMSRASLRGATRLNYADLSGATLIGAHFNSTDLSNVNLQRASLALAYLNNADLRSADLTGADLDGADLTGAEWPEDAALPPGWKRGLFFNTLQRDRQHPGLPETEKPAESGD